MIIAGAGGFAKELVHVLCTNYPEIRFAFFDDITSEKNFLQKFEVLKSIDQVIAQKERHQNSFAIGVGNPQARLSIYNKFIEAGFSVKQVISKTAVLGAFHNIISDGVTIMDHVVIEACNTIGKGTLLHTGCFVSHDVKIGSFCEISPYAKLLGKVTIGNYCSIGAGAIVLPGITVNDGAIVGAGAVVTKNVSSNMVVVGVPAAELKRQ